MADDIDENALSECCSMLGHPTNILVEGIINKSSGEKFLAAEKFE